MEFPRLGNFATHAKQLMRTTQPKLPKERKVEIPTLSPARRRIETLRKILLSPWGLFVGLAGLVASFLTISQVYFDTLPEIHPNEATGPSSATLPFSVHNRSNYFNLNDVQLFCEWKVATWQGAGTFQFRSVALPSVTRSSRKKGFKITAADSINFPCDPSDGFGVPYENDQAMTLVDVRLHVRMEYSINLAGIVWSRVYFSPEFNWQDTPSGFQWYEGQLIR